MRGGVGRVKTGPKQLAHTLMGNLRAIHNFTAAGTADIAIYYLYVNAPKEGGNATTNRPKRFCQTNSSA